MSHSEAQPTIPTRSTNVQAAEKLAAQPNSCSGLQAPHKPIFSTEVRTCSHWSISISDPGPGGRNLERLWPIKGDNTYLLFECRKWRHERNKLYRDPELDGVMRPTAAEEHPQGLLEEPKATKALLQFLANTSVAPPEHTDSKRRKGPENMMNGDWKHWRKRLERAKDSREGSLS